MSTAYLINQYPKVSHSFIRREIQALEALGHSVQRYAIRGWEEQQIDPSDQSEQQKTQYILNARPVELLICFLEFVLLNPFKTWLALRDSFELVRFQSKRRWIGLAYLLEAMWIAKLVRAAKVTHIHAHFGTNAAAVALLCNSLGGPSFSFTVHGPEEFDAPKELNLAFKVERAKFVAVVSSFGKSQLSRWCTFGNWKKLHIIRCGLDEDFFAKPPVEVNTSKQLLCIGRLSEQKGHHVLIDALALAIANGCNVQLVLAGDGEMRAELEARVKAKNLQAHVTFSGWVSGQQVQTLLANSRALVVPSFAEGLPVVIMESYAQYRPVISTYIAGIPELVESNQSGWLVPAASVKDLARAIEVCLKASETELGQLAAAGYAKVRTLHHIEDSAKLLIEQINATNGE